LALCDHDVAGAPPGALELRFGNERAAEPPPGRAVADAAAGKKSHLLRCHFMLKMILVPRQARDKHKESTQKERCVFLQISMHFHLAKTCDPKTMKNCQLKQQYAGWAQQLWLTQLNQALGYKAEVRVIDRWAC